MGAKGFVIAEEGHLVNILPPQSMTIETRSDVFSMKNHSHVTIIVTAGSTNADAGNIYVEACDDFTPTTHTEMAFSYYAEETAAGDTLGARTAKTSAEYIDVSANDNIMYVIEIDAAELPSGLPNLANRWSAPGGATLVSAVAVLSGARYGSDQSATEIA